MTKHEATFAPRSRPLSRLRVASEIHRFWRERMRDAPSLDHALACVMSGIELDAAIDREARS